MPELPNLFRRPRLSHLQAGFPAGLTQAHGQRVQGDLHPLGTALVIPIECQVVDLDRLALGVGAFELRGIETHRRALQHPLAPVHPKLTTGLDFGKIPLLGHPLRQPLRPIALRQAQVGIDLRVFPVTGANPAAQAHGQWLAIGQGQPCVETLAADTGFKRQANVRQGQRLVVERLQGDLAVEHRQSGHHLHLVEQSLGVQGLVLLHRKAFQRPLTVRAFLEAELQAIEFQVFDPHRARQQAGPDMQGVGTLADHHVMGHQDRPHATPAALEAANAQGYAQRVTGFGLDLGAVLGDQRNQLSTEVDVECDQHQQQRTEPQAPASQRA
ncbi:hypothetical protein D3C85_680760 [compost metagenome]